GKTAVMAARVVWLTEEAEVSSSQILGLTFTNKAAAELEERIMDAFSHLDPPPAEHPHIATYHAFADALLREHGVRIGIDPEAGLLSERQRWQLLLPCFDMLPPFDAVASRSPASICRSVLGLGDACGNPLVTPERVIEEDERVLRDAAQFPDDVVACSRKRIELARVVRAYTDAKLRARRIDFGDQVTRAVETMEDPTVAAELRARYPAILLAEYQDTTVAQRRRMPLLPPTGHNVPAVQEEEASFIAGEIQRLHAPVERAAERPNETPAGPPGATGEPEAPHKAPEKGEPSGTATPWSEFAVLVRRKSHIRPIHDALRA